MTKGYLRSALLLCMLIGIAGAAEAQTVLQPGQVIAVDFDPGRMLSGTTTVVRPEANIVFDFKIDGAATAVAAVKARACTGTAPVVTCYLTPPTLAEGTHTIAVSAKPSPAETGINPSAFSSPLSVAVILVTAPSTPGNLRLIP